MKQRRGLWTSLAASVIVGIALLGATLGASWSPKLGLDLDGGLAVTYQTARPVSSGQLSTIVNIMNNRVDALGATGATVASQGKNQVAVSIPGAKNVQQILDTIGNTAQLYFRPALCYAPAYTPPKSGASPSGPLPSCGSQYALTQANLGVKPDPASTSGFTANNVPPDPAFAAYRSTPDVKGATVLLSAAKGAGGGRYVLGPAALTGSIVKSASAQLVNGTWVVDFTLTSSGSSAWDKLAAQQFHQIIAVDLGGTVISAPITSATSSAPSSFNGSVQVSGGFTESQAKELAVELNYGSLPVKLNRLTVQTVSPTLGKSSLDAGLISGLAGLVLVLAYILVYYRLLGVVVVSGLLLTGSVLWSVIAAMGHSLGTTIDLAGVIGVIVSVGITVDSYIVYFERLKDEARSGRTVRTSVDRGFASAYRTVLAADAVSLLGAAILYFISIGSVRGFALFLGISTVLDVVVTYFFTRPFVILLGRSKAATQARGLGVARGLGMDVEGAK